MNIPKLSYRDFLSYIARSNIVFAIKSNSNIQNNKPRLTIKAEIEEIKKLVNNKVIENFPTINTERNINLALLTRIALYLSIELNINSMKFLSKYNIWRESEGKDIFVFYSAKLNKRIDVDQFILKGKRDIDEFQYEWIGLKPALSENTPINKNRIKPDSGVGQKNYLKLKNAINSAALEKKIPRLYFQTFIKEDETTLHEFNGSRDQLYFLMKTRTKLDMKQSIFKKIITDFVKVYYRKDMPQRLNT